MLFAMLGLTAPGSRAIAAPSEYFRITVIDDSTGRGVPLVELRTVNEIRYYTDSNGIAAIGEPDLLSQTIYFTISSPGYEYPADSFGYHGVALQVTPGGRAVIKIKRDNIAERLYRVTGAGIYRDSVLVGQSAPIKQPLLDGQVIGQDTVEVTPYLGKLYWFFGDTNRPSYPLGQFATSGATSQMPGRGGLDPAAGVDLIYWVGSDGFSKPMIPLPNPPGPVWIGGLFTLMDGGRQHLFTRYTEINHDQSIASDGLAEFNDDKSVFESISTYPKDDPLRPEGHPFLVDSNGERKLYFQSTVAGAFPLVRVVPDRKHLIDASSFEAFTCLAQGARDLGTDTHLERNGDGKLVWGWKRDTPALSSSLADKLVAAGKMRADEMLTVLHDVDTDKTVLTPGGSVFWNAYRKRWIMITTQAFGSPSFLGEVWFAEADTPVGPWLYAKKIATHDGYTFYNPTQHPFFDQSGGRLIYFEGTYTDTYSGVKDLTPRYNYNQLMYRLDLSDPRLSLPAPVYRLMPPNGSSGYGMGEEIATAGHWAQVQSIPFYAVPPDRAANGLVPVYADATKGGAKLTLAPPVGEAKPLFYALPITQAASEKPALEVTDLYEYSDPKTGQYWYAPNANSLPLGALRSPLPLCRVWRNPSSVLALDTGAKIDTLP
ncbi:MAG: hypothetical protein ACRYFS_03285 [Janthinobacterium lividum]